MRANGSDDLISPLYFKLNKKEFYEEVKEETRILYVAMTRAKNILVTPFAKEHNSWGDLLQRHKV